VLEESFDKNVLFARVPEYHPSPDDIIVDIGAHIGTFALLASSMVPQGRVYAVEACEETFNFLTVNVVLNRAANIQISHLAIMDKKGIVTLYHDSGAWGHSAVKRLSRHSETVQACSLRDFLEGSGIERCDFLKLNCEGAEFPIILSTPPDVLQFCRRMLVLYHLDLWRANTLEDLTSHLTASGFQCEQHSESMYRGWVVATSTTDAHTPSGPRT
jgi:FkbM family methyltransferase